MKNRLVRVRELLQRELGTILARDHAFPGVLVTVNDVDITPDLRNAHVFIGVVGPAHRQEEVVEKLNRERGSFQARISKRVILRNTPILHFKLDHSVERGVRVSRIMEEIDEQLLQSAILNPDPVVETPAESSEEEREGEETAAIHGNEVEPETGADTEDHPAPAEDDGEEGSDEEGAPARVRRNRR